MIRSETAWILASSALVMLMTPALGFFYAGLVRKKNVLATIMHSFFILCLISVQWVLWGYTLAFGPDHWGLIGGLDWFGLRGVGMEPNADYAPTVPHQAYMLFQMMFAIITPALISGAFAERKRFSSFVLFSVLWATLVYDPIAHWVWGAGGWLHNLGTLDFAGGSVVHISSGVAALVAAIVLGKRIGVDKDPIDAHDATMTILGASLLWFGWFGFNAGSAIAAGGLAVGAFVATNSAAAMGALAWTTLSWWRKGRPSVVGAAAGSIAGLATITPASGYVDVWASLLIGLLAGVGCYAAVQLRPRLRADDALDVFGVHGVGGTIGVLATGLFASVAVNPGAANGLFFGNPGQFGVQLIAVVATWAYSAVATLVILKVVGFVLTLRVSAEHEPLGLDASQHGEQAYNF